jgi:hypothetical protein
MLQTRDKWDILALATFLIILVGCGALIERSGGIVMIVSFSFLDLTVVSLAAFRMLHLITYDKIFAFVRNYFDKRGKREDADGGYRYIDGFLECLWCTGVWSGLIALTIYMIGPWGQFVTYVFAAAGVASLLQLASHAFAKRD